MAARPPASLPNPRTSSAAPHPLHSYQPQLSQSSKSHLQLSSMDSPQFQGAVSVPVAQEVLHSDDVAVDDHTHLHLF